MNTTTFAKVPFNSPSDALLASLLCLHDFSIPDVRRCLNVLRDMRAHEINGPTVDTVDAMYRHTSETLRLRGIARSRPIVPSHACAGIPMVVLDGVIQCFFQERPPFEHSSLTMESTPVPLCNRALANMSLVHRTWTTPAQRALFSSITVLGTKGLRSALASPCIGPWTRELCFKWHHVWRADEDPKGEPCEEVLPLLSTLLRHITNVRKLTIWTYFTETNVAAINSFLETLKDMRDIEELQLLHKYTGDDTDPGCPHVHELCMILPFLRRLRALSIKQWVMPSFTPAYEARRRMRQRGRTRPPKARLHPPPTPSPPSLGTAPSSTLESIVLDSTDISFTYIDWLLRPRGNYAPKRVSISLHSIDNVPDDLDEFWMKAAAWFHSADTVHFDMLSWTRYRFQDDPALKESSKRMIAACQTARAITLGVFGEHALQDLGETILPPVVEILHINILLYQCDPPSIQWQSQMEESVHRLLTNSDLSRLRQIVLVPDSYDLRERWKTYTIHAGAGISSELPMINNVIKQASRLDQFCQERHAQLVYANNPFSSLAMQ